jgi:hypothetical protein
LFHQIGQRGDALMMERSSTEESTSGSGDKLALAASAHWGRPFICSPRDLGHQ